MPAPTEYPPHSTPLILHPGLSVCLIVKDEAQTLVTCLQSVAGIADQLVGIDTGSSDQSPAIAASFGAEVYNVPWADDFSAARNAAIAKARQAWILFIDADEALVSPDAATLKLCLTAITQRFKGTLPRLLVQIHNLNDSGQADKMHLLVRLFPNKPGFIYSGRIHEQLVYQGSEPSPLVPLPQLVLRHSGYTRRAL
ncbi:MAG: hypothetical protein CVV27_10195, partial [Candidatus Melainabacteria bacterium HGW-Melainabacteria-1]